MTFFSTTWQRIGVALAITLQAGVGLIAVAGSVYSVISPMQDTLEWVGLMGGLLALSLGGLAAAPEDLRIQRGVLGLSLPGSVLFWGGSSHPAFIGAGFFVLALLGLVVSLNTWRDVQAHATTAAASAKA